MEVAAIDYKKLLREERKRAREQARGLLTSSAGREEGDVAAAPPTTTTEKENTLSASSSNQTDQNQLPSFQGDLLLYASRIKTFQPDLQVTCSTVQSIRYHANIVETEFADELLRWLKSIPEGSTGLDTNLKVMKYSRRSVCMVNGFTSGSILETLASYLVEQGIFASDTPPNHCLINYYSTPNQGIMPHTDGPAYLDCTATISLGSPVLLNFAKRLETDEIGRAGSGDNESDASPIQAQVHLEHKSMVVFAGDAYRNFCHSIENGVETETALECCINAELGAIVRRTGCRWSLTFRHRFE